MSVVGKRALNFNDITGKTFGRLLVLGIDRIREYKDGHGRNKKRVVWLCQCSCGKNITRETYRLVTGNTKSCGCLHRDKTIEFNKRTKRLDAGHSAFNNVFSRYKYDAEKRNLSWEISFDEFKQLTQDICHYCGKEPSQVSKGQWSDCLYNGIDRLDSNIGYTKGNCVTCCGQCNLMKLDLSYDDFFKVIRHIYERHMLNIDNEFTDPRKSAQQRNERNNNKKNHLSSTQSRSLKKLNPNIDYKKILNDIEKEIT